MICNFLKTTEVGQQVIASVRFDGVRVTPLFNEKVARVLIGEPIMVGNTLYDSTKNPREWFNGLPQQYNGSQFRAQIVTG